MPGQPTRQPQRGINPTVSGPMDSRQDPLLRNVASILSKMWGVSETIANKTIDLLDNGKWDKSMSADKIASIINKDPSLRERARVAEQTKIPENPDTFAAETPAPSTGTFVDEGTKQAESGVPEADSKLLSVYSKDGKPMTFMQLADLPMAQRKKMLADATGADTSHMSDWDVRVAEQEALDQARALRSK